MNDNILLFLQGAHVYFIESTFHYTILTQLTIFICYLPRVQPKVYDTK